MTRRCFGDFSTVPIAEVFPSVLFPVLAAVLLAVGVTTAHRRLVPVLAAKTAAACVVVVVAAAVPTLWIISLDFLVHLPIFGHGLEWCSNVFGVRRRIPDVIGLPTSIMSVAGLVRSVRFIRTHRRLRCDDRTSVEVADCSVPFAYTLPGKGGRIVISTGLIELLDDDEQGVVIAHEQAHARHRHDRYVLIGQLAVINVPLLRPLVKRLHFALERWADEAAVFESSGDRRFVAETLGKVALTSMKPVGALGIVGLGVPGRVAALLVPPPTSQHPIAVCMMWMAIAATAALALVQLHHLLGLLTALCPG